MTSSNEWQEAVIKSKKLSSSTGSTRGVKNGEDESFLDNIYVQSQASAIRGKLQLVSAKHRG